MFRFQPGPEKSPKYNAAEKVNPKDNTTPEGITGWAQTSHSYSSIRANRNPMHTLCHSVDNNTPPYMVDTMTLKTAHMMMSSFQEGTARD